MRSLPLPTSTSNGSTSKAGFVPIGSGANSTISNGSNLAGMHIVPMNVKRKAGGAPSGGTESVVKK